MAIPLEARFPGTPPGVRALRGEITGLAKDCGMDADAIANVRLAVTEAATNAVMHAYAEAEGELRVGRRDARRRTHDRHRGYRPRAPRWPWALKHRPG